MEIVSKTLMFTKTCARISKISLRHLCSRNSGKNCIIDGGGKGLRLASTDSLHRFEIIRPLSTVEKDHHDQDSLPLQDTFIYTDYSKIEDEKKQSCYLTKSVLKHGLPPVYDRPLDLEQSELDSIYDDFEEHLIDSFLFCYGEEELHRKKYSVINAFLNMMQTTWRRTTNRYPANLGKTLFYKQHVTAAFNRCGQFNIHIGGKPKKSFLMMSRNPVQQFATNEEVAKSSDDSIVWDEVYDPIFNFRIAKINSRIITPFITGSPYPNPHTLFITADKKNVEMKRLIGHGILYTFAHAYAHALSKPQNKAGMKEIEPISVQCVVTDGQKMSFICHQLNTLDFENDNGIKNLVWIEDEIEMFKYAYLKFPGDKRYKDITETTIYLEDVNRMAFEKFLKFVLN